MPRPSVADKRRTFRELHKSGCWVIPNPWDVGSARWLQGLGFKALASTSSGYAWSVGYADNAVGVDMVLAHLKEICDATDVPVNADFEGGYADEPAGVAANVTRCCATGVAGLSIEDSTGNKDKPLYDIPFAVERMKAARAAIDKAAPDVLLTGRAEGFIAGVPDLEQMIARLKAYAAAGADVLYAPGIKTREQIEAVVKAVAPKPVNFLNGAAFGHYGRRSRRHGRAAHQRRRRAGALRLGRIYPHGEGDRRAGHVRGLQGCGLGRGAEWIFQQGPGGAMSDLSNWTPPPFPPRKVLEGAYCRLEPLDVAKHGAQIAAAFVGAHDVWAYLPVEEPKDRAAYEKFLASMVERTDIVPYAVIDKADNKAKGHLWLMEIRPAHGVFEVGFITYSPPLQRTRAATEAIYLCGDYGFGLGYRRFEWKCNNRNEPSQARRAALRLQVRGPVPPASDREGPEPRYRVVLDPRLGMAGAEGRVHPLART